MSALSSLSMWLRRFYDRLSAPAVVLGDKGSRWFEKAKCTPFGTTCEFKKTKLPMGLTTLEDRLAPATFYVSPTGSDANPGTALLPFRSVQFGVNAAAAVSDGNDVVNVAGGVFNSVGVDARFDVPSSANLDNLQLLGGWNATFTTRNPSATPTLYTFTNSPALNRYDLQILDNNVTVDGFTLFSNSTAPRDADNILVQSQNVTISNNILHTGERSGGSRPIGVATSAADTSGLQILNNVFNINAGAPTSTTAAIGVFLNPSVQLGAITIDGNTFNGNNMNAAVIVSGVNNVTVQNNTVNRNTPVFGNIIELRNNLAGVSNVQILNNSLLDTSASVANSTGILLGGSGALAVNNVTIRGNIVAMLNNAAFFAATGTIIGGLTVERNAFDSTLAGGVAVSAIPGLDVSGNWLGSANQATVDANLSTTGGGTVVARSFLSSNADANPGAPGLQLPAATKMLVPQTATTSGLTKVDGRIQSGINRATTGMTVEVAADTFVENVSINKNLTLRSSSGRAVTTIQGISGLGALGAVVVTGSTTGVTIGGAPNNGFKIVGIDNNNPGIENAALYVQGSHSGLQVLNNEIVANGDAGLTAEYGQTNTNWTIDSNIFSGTTFFPPPADNGFANQFTTPNVPRQLVVIGSGGGGAASGPGLASGIAFTNNQVTGTAGGVNGGGEQGNTLVTIDAGDSTITGNTFAGTTTRFGSALRVRRPNTAISGNTFNTSGMTASTNSIFVENNTTPIQTIVAGNTLDRGAYIVGGTTVWQLIQTAINNSVAGQTVAVLPANYAENLLINKALTLQGPNTPMTPAKVVGGAGTAITVSTVGAATVTVDGFTITGAQGIIDPGADLVIQNNVINTVGIAVDLSTANSGTILNNKITSTVSNGIYGLSVATFVLIQGNLINAAGNGVYLDGIGGTVTVGGAGLGQPNDITAGGGVGSGVYLKGLSSSAIVSSNTINADFAGVYASTVTGSLTVESNDLTFPGTVGVYATGIGGPVVIGGAGLSQGNTVAGQLFGIYVQGADTVAVQGNKVSNTTTGILVDDVGVVGTPADISGNNFNSGTDNTYDIYLPNTAGIVALGAGNIFGGDDYFVYNDSPNSFDLTSYTKANYENLYDPSVLADAFRIEDFMYHKTDNAATGLIRVNAGQIYVTTPGTGANDETIQGGVNAASGSDTVRVEAGTFTENVKVAQSVRIWGAGQGKTFVVPANADPQVNADNVTSSLGGTPSNVFLIQANNVTINDLTIDGNNPALTSGIIRGGQDIDARNGIITDHTLGTFNNLKVQNVTVQNIYLRGIYASSGGSFLLDSNIVQNVRGNFAAIGIFNWVGAGTISNNFVTDTNDAISANHSSGTLFTNNIVTNSDSGIHTDNMGDGGIGVDTIQFNSVSTGTGVTSYGIFVFAPYKNVVVDQNTVSGVDVGMGVFGSFTGPTVALTKNNVNLTGHAGSYGVWVSTTLFGFGSANVKALIDNNNSIQGAGTGILVEQEPGFTAQVTISNNLASIFGNVIGIDVNAGSATITNNHIYDNTTGIRFTNGGNGQINGNEFRDTVGFQSNSTDLRLDSTAGAVTLGSNNAFAGGSDSPASFANSTGYFIDNQSSNAFDLTSNGTTFWRSNGSSNTQLTTGSLTNNFRLEDRMFHKVDSGSAGLVRWNVGQIYVTTPGTGANNETIQGGVDAAANGDTVHIEAGSYTGNVNTTAPGLGVNLSPGASPGQVNITGDLTLDGNDTVTIEIDGTNAANQFDNFVLTGSATIGGAALNLSGSYTPLPGNSFKIIDAATGLTGTFAGYPNNFNFVYKAQPMIAKYLGAPDFNFVLAYDSNPVINGTNGGDDILIRRTLAPDNIQVLVNNVVVMDTPFASLSSLTINGLDGNDTFTVKYDHTGGYFTLPITINGDGPVVAPGDRLNIVGNAFDSITGNFVNLHDGNFVMDPTLGGNSTISFTGLEPVLVNVGSVADLVFNLPAAATTATLGDDGTSGNGLSRLSGDTFEQTDFSNPTNSLTVNGDAGAFNDSITVNSLPDMTAKLTVNGQGGTDTITVATALSTTKDLSFVAELVNLNANLSTDSSPVSFAGSGNVVLGASVTIDTEQGANSAGGNVNFGTAAVSAGAALRDLTIDTTGTTAGNTSLAAFTAFGGALVDDLTINGGAAAGTFTITAGISITSVLVARSAIFVDSSAATPDISASKLALEASAGIGSVGNPLNTAVSNLEARTASTVALTGGIFISNTAATLTIGNASAAPFTGVQATLIGDVVIINAGTIDINNEDIDTTSGNVTVSATGATSDVRTGVASSNTDAIDSDNGSITVIAGRDIIIGTTVFGEIEANGNLSLTSGQDIILDKNSYIDVLTSAIGAIVASAGRDIKLQGTSKVQFSTQGGAISLTTGATGVFTSTVTGSGSVIKSNNGTITITSNDVIISGTLAINSGTNSTTFQPVTAATPINLGAAGGLSLDDTELDRVTAATLIIGSATAGAITVAADQTRPASTAVQLTSNANISFTTGQFNTGGGTLLLTPAAAGAVLVPKTGVDATASTVSFNGGSDLSLAIAGNTADAPGYDRLNVTGAANITNTDLVLTGAYVPVNGDSFTIVTTTAGVTGNFNGLPDGFVFNFNGSNLVVTYPLNKVVLGYVNISIVGGDLVYNAPAGRDDNITVRVVGGNFNIYDPDPTHLFFSSVLGTTGNGTNNLSIPTAPVTGKLIFNTNDGSDVLTQNWSTNFVNNLEFNGGTGATDRLFITQGTFDSIVGNYANANDGNFVLDPTGAAAAKSLTYTGLEPITLHVTSVMDLTFNLPASANDATVDNGGFEGDGLSRLKANNGSFETTVFTTPYNSLTVNGQDGTDTIDLNGLDLGASQAEVENNDVTFTGFPGVLTGGQSLETGGWNTNANANIENATTRPHISVNGTGDGTVDWFSFNVAVAGSIATFDIDTTTVSANLDTEIAVYNSAGVLISTNDDEPVLDPGSPGPSPNRHSAIRNLVLPTAGTYFVVVTQFNSVFANFPAGITTSVGVAAGNTYTLHVSLDNHAIVAGPDPIVESEPNAITFASPPGILAGGQNVDANAWSLFPSPNIANATSRPHTSIVGSGDGTYDFYSFTVSVANSLVTLDIDNENFDTEIFLFDSSGALIASNDDDSGDPGTLGLYASAINDFTISAAGTYFIGVAKFNSSGATFPVGVTGAAPAAGDFYTLHISLENHPTNAIAIDPNVFINGGNQDDLINITASTLSGSLTADGDAGNDTVNVINNLTTGSTGKPGNVSIVTETVALTGNIAATNSANIDVNAVNSFTVPTLTADNTVTLTASAGSITDGNAAANNVTAAALAVVADNGIGSAGDALDTAIANLEAETETGGVFFSNTGDLNIGGVTGALAGVRANTFGSGNIELSVAGSLFVILSSDSIFNFDGDVTLVTSVPTGDIVTGTGTTSVYAYYDVTLNSGRDVILGFAGDYGDVRSEDEDVTVFAGRHIVVQDFTYVSTGGAGNQINFAAGTGGGAGNISIQASSDSEVFNSTGVGGPINFTTAPGGLFSIDAGVGGVFSNGGDVTVNADNMDINSDVDADTGIATLQPVTNATLIELGGADGVGILGLTNAELGQVTAGILRIGNSNSGAVTVSKDISPAGTSTLHIRTGSTITGTAGGIIETNLSLSAGGTINVTDTDTAVSNLAATTSGGDITFVNKGALTISSVDGVTGVTGPGFANISTASPLTVAADVIVGGNVTLSAGEIDDDPTCADDLTVNSGIKVQSTGGDVTLRSGDDLIVQGSATVQAFGNVFLTAGFGDLDMCGDLIINGSIIMGGNLDLCATTTVTLGSTITAPGTVTIFSMLGSIVDNNVGMDITAAALAMKAATGVGSLADPIETSVSNLEGQVTGAGGFFVDNSGKSMTLGGIAVVGCGIGTLNGVSTANGDMRATNTHAMVVGEAVGAAGVGGDVTLEANLAATAVGNFVGLTVNGGDVTTVDGNITLAGNGGDTLTLNHGVVIAGKNVTAGGTGTIGITGTGGASTGNSNIGVFITAAAQVTTAGGNLTVTGTGGGTGVTSGNRGLRVDSGSLVATVGSGKLQLLAKGGTTSGGSGDALIIVGPAVVSTVNGDLLLQGKAYGTGAGNQNIGVFITNAGSQVKSTGTGKVTLDGLGGASSGQLNVGTLIQSGALISTASGDLKIQGTGGGTGASKYGYGVSISSAGTIVSAGGSGKLQIIGQAGSGSGGGDRGTILGTGTVLTSLNGDIEVTGNAGGTGPSDIGVFVLGTQLKATGTGNLSIIGVGAPNGSGTFNAGIQIQSAGLISTASGNLTLTGTAGGTGAASTSRGVTVSGATVSAGGSGNLTIAGTGSTATGGANQGILIAGATGLVSAANGNIVLTGTEGVGTGSVGIETTTAGATVKTTGSGNITVNANSMALGAGTSINAGANVVTLLQLTSGVGIDLGTAANTLGGPVGLSNAELDTITAGLLRIGNANTGAVVVSADIDLTATETVSNLTLTTGSTITGTAGGVKVDNLALSASDVVNFSSITTDVDTLAISTSNDNASFLDADGLVIATVDGVVGVQIGSGNFSLTAGGAVTQSQKVIAAGMEMLGAGSFTLTNVNNDVNNIAGNTGGLVDFVDTDDVNVATVNSVGLTSAANVTLKALTANLTVTSFVKAAGFTATLTSVAGSIVDGNAGANNISALSAELSAATGIDADTAVTNLAAVSNSGNITIDNTGLLNITTVGALTGISGSGSATITTASPLNVNANVIMGGAVLLEAKGTNDVGFCVDDVTINAGVKVQSTGSDVTIFAEDDIFLAGTATIQANGVVTLEAAHNDSGDMCGALTLLGTIISGGALNLCAADDLTVGSLSASGTVSLRSMNGKIIDGNGAANNVTAPALGMGAKTGIGVGDAIETAVNVIEAETESGGIFVDNTSASLTVGDITPLGCMLVLTGVRATTSGDIELTNTGAINVTVTGQDVEAAGGSIRLQTSSVSGDINTGNGTAYGNVYAFVDLKIISAGNVFLGTGNKYGDSYAVTGNATISAAGNINIDSFTFVTTNGGDIFLTAGGNISIDNTFKNSSRVASFGGDIVITTGAGGVFTLDTVNNGVFTVGGQLTVSADDMVITSGTLSAGAGIAILQQVTPNTAINFGGAGGLNLTDAELDRVTASILRVGNASSGAMTFNQDISLASAKVPTLKLTTPSTITGTLGGIIVNNLAINAGGVVNFTDTTTDVDNLAVATTNDNAFFRDADGLDINTVDGIVGVNVGSGNFSLTAGGGVTQSQAIFGLGLELLGAGPFTLTLVSNDVDNIAGNATGFVNYVDADDLNVGTVNTVGLTATANVDLKALTSNLTLTKAVTATGSTATLTASAGAIVDGNGAGNNIAGLSTALSAATGIDADTAVTNLAAISTTGNITIDNTGLMNITTVGALTGVSGNGSATITTASPMNVNSNVVMTGDVLLEAFGMDDDPACIDDVTINAGVLVRSTGGNVTIFAEDDIFLHLTATIQANGNVVLEAAHNDSGDMCGALNLFGTIISGGNIDLCAGDDITVGSFISTGGTITVRSKNGAIIDGNGAATNLTAPAVALSANKGIGSFLDFLDTDTAKLEAETVTGGIFVENDSAALTVGGVTPGCMLVALNGYTASVSGDVHLKTAGTLQVNEQVATTLGNATLEATAMDLAARVAASGTAILTASAGAISDSTDKVAGTEVQANVLVATATGGVELDTAVNFLTVIAGGPVTLRELDGVQVNSITSAGNLILLSSTDGSSTFTLQPGNALDDTSTVEVDTGTELDLNGDNETVGALQGNGKVVLPGQTLTTGGNGASTLFTGVISGASGNVVKVGAGTMTMSGANTYTGTTSVLDGTLAMGANNVFADLSSLVVNGAAATFAMFTFNDTVLAVSLINGAITGTGGTLTSKTDFDVRNGLASANLAGAVGLIKTTAGIVTLSGANTYTGVTNINGGVLNYSGSLTGVGGDVLLNANGVVLDGLTTGVITDRGVQVVAGKTNTFVQNLATVTKGATQAGLTINTGASATVRGNSIQNNQIGVLVSGGTALIENNNLSNNNKGNPSLAAGLTAEKGAIVDAGQSVVATKYYTHFTGLAGGTGPAGASAGLNTFLGYDITWVPGSPTDGGIAFPKAIRNNNVGGTYAKVGPQFGVFDLTAMENTFDGTPDLFLIEKELYHDVDDFNRGFISYGSVGAMTPATMTDLRYYAYDPNATYGADIDDFTLITTGSPAGKFQASEIRRLQATFDGFVFLDNTASSTVLPTTSPLPSTGAIQIYKRNGPALTSSFTQGFVNVNTLSASYNQLNGAYTMQFGFTNPGGQYLVEPNGSLTDGNYQLVLNDTLIQGGGPGGAALTNPGPVRNFHRFFGDHNGDRRVDNVDLKKFNAALGGTFNPTNANWRGYFNFDTSGASFETITSSDFSAFNRRYKQILNANGTTSPIPYSDLGGS